MPSAIEAERAGAAPGDPTSRRRLLRARSAVLLAVALAIGLQALNWGFGRRDNGDWPRYSTSFARAPVGFRAADEPGTEPVYRPHTVPDWRPRWERKSPLERPFSRPDTGSSYLLWLPGWALNRLVFESPVLDLRLLGLPARALVTAALAVLVGALAGAAPDGRRWSLALPMAAAALAGVHFDLGVVSYANTFFRETAGQVGIAVLLGTLALPAESWVRWRWLLAAAACFAATSGSVHLALVAPLAVLPQLAGAAGRRAIGVAVGAAAVATLLFSYFTVVPKLARNAAFNALYFGLLPESRDPGALIERLGLSPESRALVGRRVFEEESRSFLASHAGPTHGDVLAAAAAEPMAFARLLARGAPHLAGRVDSLGTRSAADPGPPPTLLNAPRFGAWRWSGVESGTLGLLALAGLAGLLGLRSGDAWRRRLAVLTTFCVLAAAAELAANLLGDGRSALDRHLFLARILSDHALIFAVLLALSFLPAPGLSFRSRSMRRPYAEPPGGPSTGARP